MLGLVGVGGLCVRQTVECMERFIRRNVQYVLEGLYGGLLPTLGGWADGQRTFGAPQYPSNAYCIPRMHTVQLIKLVRS